MTPDEVTESHIEIQHRIVIERLDALRTEECDITNSTEKPLDTEARSTMARNNP